MSKNSLPYTVCVLASVSDRESYVTRALSLLGVYLVIVLGL